MTQKLVSRLIEAIANSIIANAEVLTTLDQAIGDGDHGANMRRGAKALKTQCDEISSLEFAAALKKAGTAIVMTVGGASGPLYGSALLGMAKAASGVPKNAKEASVVVRAGIDAVKARGKSDAGAKTMLDVLVPVQSEIESGSSIARIRTVAEESLEATKPMLAKKGRAAFLGERSIGHADPGAKSAALIVHAICDVLEAQ
ncbi:MAG: dihydroxyacetone kinase subunit DhaL [Albidovulum sp.]|nr:dihydroxyacetone kinase subunit DhaL [Albidovulum sp.]